MMKLFYQKLPVLVSCDTMTLVNGQIKSQSTKSLPCISDLRVRWSQLANSRFSGPYKAIM